MNKEQIKDYIDDHKKELALIAASVTGIAIWLIAKNKAGMYPDINRPELPSGEWRQLFKVGVKDKRAGGISGCAVAVDVADLGKFGEMLTTIETIDAHEPIRIVFGTERSYNNG